MPRSHAPTPTVRRLLAALGLAAVIGTVLAPAGFAADAPTMEARVMLGGHARVGTWMAVDVRLRNEGPAVTGELRIAGGAQARTRYTAPVELGTPADKTYRLYAQPPAFGGNIEVSLVSGDRTLVKQSVPFQVHEAAQLVVGVLAENAGPIVGDLDLLPGASGVRAAVLPLAIADLPDRVEAWGAIDRLIWQDVDSSQLRSDQLAAMRGWIAGGGRLVIAGGTAGIGALGGFPDDLLPYRPVATVDAAPQSLGGLLGELPDAASDLPALAGELARGRSLATSGDRTIAAEAIYGSGSVALLGFDPTTPWIADSPIAGALWRGLMPPRTSTLAVSGDDGQLVQAVSQLPALALPPIGGLLGLLAGYIVLIGPVNYLVLRRLDRREWAWVTMPLLIAVFAAGSYGYGAVLRGLDVIVNEVAVVRGAPDATEGTAQVYLGVFSPSRGTYQVEVPGGALLSSTLTGDFGGGETSLLVVTQGEPSRIRDLVVGFGSLRTVRAETATTVPRIQSDLRLVNGTLSGTIRNLSDELLERPAIVLGSSVVVLGDLAPGAQQTVSLALQANQFGDSLSNRMLGQIFFTDPSRTNERTQQSIVRHAVIDQLTYDPVFGSQNVLPSETPVLLAWGTRSVLDVRIEGQIPRRTGNVLYYIPVPMTIAGPTVFEGELIRNSLVESDAVSFSKDPFSINFGQGSITMAYRPVTFDGSLAASRLLLGMNTGGDGTLPGRPVPIDPMPPVDPAEPPVVAPVPPCDPNVQECFFDVLPSVEVFDRTDSAWVPLPEMTRGQQYELDDAGRYVDPPTGTLLVRFTHEQQSTASFTFNVRIEGEVR